MRKTFILTAAIIMAMSVLTGRLFADENSVEKGSPGVHRHGVSKNPSEEPQKAEETRRSAEEAKKTIVARVNGVDINMFMLVRAMNRVAPKYVKEGEEASPEPTVKIRTEALDMLIFEELAVQEAIRQGINPSPEAIDKVVAQVRENAGSEEAYREYLDKTDLTEETLKKLIERSQRYELITAREVYGKISIDEKLLKDEYEKEKGKFILPDNFVAEDVFLLQVKDGDAAHKKVNEVLKSIRKNNNDVWKLVLDGTFIVRKINIRQEKHPAIYNAMTEMNVGDLSGVIQDKDGFHIIKVVKKDMSRPATFEEARGALEPKFRVPAQEQRKQEWERELKKDAKIELMLDDVEKNIGIFGKK